MVNFCCVYKCSNRSDRESELSYFRLPSEITNQGDATRQLSLDRKRRWLSVLRLKSRTTDFKSWDRICSVHFVSGKKSELFHTNDVDWVPTLHLGHDQAKLPKPSDMVRGERAKRRRSDKIVAQEAIEIAKKEIAAADELAQKEIADAAQLAEKERHAAEVLLDFATQLDITTSSEPESNDEPIEILQHKETQTEPQIVSSVSIQTQTDLTGEFLDILRQDSLKVNEDLYRPRDQVDNKHEISENNLKNDDERVRYYTGLTNFLLLTAVFDLISPYISKTHRSALDKFQQMMVVLMRLRLNLSLQDLAYRFGVSQSTISRIFKGTLDIMFIRLKQLIIWPERETLRKTMPMQFRKEFGQRVAVIIDCFEVFIDRPSNLLARAQTWSNYKHHNTVKYLIGITPQGTTSFLSKAWGGRTSDKVITEESGFLYKLEPGDIVLADRGFTISESVAMQGAQVHIPAFTRGKDQLSPADVDMTRKIANVRIHVERVIGCTRQKYTILGGPIPLELLDKDGSGFTIMDKVTTVCCALNNLNPSVVDFE